VWTAIKIGMLYAAPIASLLFAVVWFVVSLLRVRRGQLTRLEAAGRYAGTLLLPPIVLLAIWGTGELAGRFSGATERFVWDPEASLQFLQSLLPLIGYMYIPVVLLNVAFWLSMAVSRSGRADAGTMT
jgi:hypothetical protein